MGERCEPAAPVCLNSEAPDPEPVRDATKPAPPPCAPEPPLIYELNQKGPLLSEEKCAVSRNPPQITNLRNQEA